VGTVTHAALQLGLAIAGTLAAIGLTALVAGFGLIWVSKEGPEVVVVGSSERHREPSMAG